MSVLPPQKKAKIAHHSKCGFSFDQQLTALIFLDLFHQARQTQTFNEKNKKVKISIVKTSLFIETVSIPLW